MKIFEIVKQASHNQSFFGNNYFNAKVLLILSTKSSQNCLGAVPQFLKSYIIFFSFYKISSQKGKLKIKFSSMRLFFFPCPSHLKKIKCYAEVLQDS